MTELKDHSLTGNTLNPGGADQVDLVVRLMKNMGEGELAEIRFHLETLQPIDLEKLDLNAELALQYRQAKELMVTAQKDVGVPTNQKAQLFNTLRAQLEGIVKQQESVYSMERLKTFETAFLKAANAMTADARDLFFDLYSKHLPGGTMRNVPIAEVGQAAPELDAPRSAAVPDRPVTKA